MKRRSGETDRDGETSRFPPEEPTLYDLLWTHRGATDEEIRRAYKRQRENFQAGSLPLQLLLPRLAFGCSRQPPVQFFHVAPSPLSP